MEDGRRHLVLVNPSAGGGRAKRLLPIVERALDRGGVRHRVAFTKSLEHGRELAADAARDGEAVVVMSGDGLIGQVGGVLAGTDSPLGVIPAGRGNDFARAAEIPKDPEEAVAILAAGHTRRIDVGEVDGVRFLCIASCGFDSVANGIANETRIIRGPLVYLYAALRTLASWRPAQFTVTTNGTTTRVRGYTVGVANGCAYGGGMLLAPDASLDDGMLDVVTVADVSKLRFLSQLPKIFKGAHTANREVRVHRAREILVEADREFDVYADGDRVASLPATVSVVPGALEVIVPEGRS